MSAPKPATPLRVKTKRDSGGFWGISIADANGLFIANMVMQLDDSEKKNAAGLVHAANAYPALVEALRVERAHADEAHLREMTSETAARAARLEALLRSLGEAE